MRWPRPTIGGVGPLRDRLEHLGGLPLRPSSVRLLLDGDARPPSELDDPGWSLLVAHLGESRARDLLADLPWWEPCDDLAAEARDRLWRFSVATATAARRLALDAGDADPEAAARNGLLQPIALWALAAVAPERLLDWFEASGDAGRLQLEDSWFGRDAATFGHHLAHCWGCGPDLIDAVFLADRLPPIPPGSASDPDRLDHIRQARTWALQTPWAPSGSQASRRPSEHQRRWLVALVQSRTRGSLATLADRTGAEDPLRADARRARLEAQFERTLTDLSSRFGATLEAIERSPSEEADRRATDTLDAMAEFAAGAAHELNNPLAIIAGRAQLLQSRLTDPEHRRALQTIIGQARRAHQMLRDLIYIARPPSPRRAPCVPEHLLRSVVDDLAGEAASRRVHLIARLGRSADLRTIDPDALRHLADALIRNALEATEPGGEVVVESMDVPGFVVWTVRDTGVGLDAERAAHLLDPFYCGRQAGRGLGLGLPRVARFIRSIGGAIRWDAVPGTGTVVRVELPLEARSGVEAPAIATPDLRDAG